MTVEQLVFRKNMDFPDRDAIYLMIDGEVRGKVEYEPLNQACMAALHYSLYPDDYASTTDPLFRKGWATLMVDAAFHHWKWNPNCLLFVDDPRYRELGGRGGHTDAGRRFADAYRAKRGIVRETIVHPYDDEPEEPEDWSAFEDDEDVYYMEEAA